MKHHLLRINLYRLLEFMSITGLMPLSSFVYSVFIKIVLKQLLMKEDAIACRPITNCGINLGKATQASYICLTTTSAISIMTTPFDEKRNTAGQT